MKQDAIRLSKNLLDLKADNRVKFAEIFTKTICDPTASPEKVQEVIEYTFQHLAEEASVSPPSPAATATPPPQEEEEEETTAPSPTQKEDDEDEDEEEEEEEEE
jgi:hypothetical protein